MEIDYFLCEKGDNFTALDNLIEWISKFGEDPKGGITRLLYTREWLETQSALKSLMDGKGFLTYYDEVGNLFGRLEGTVYKEETILTGSHIDTVVNGGKLDGQLGIIGGLIAIEYLREKYGEPLRNIEVVSMAEEEGSRFPFVFWGSKNIVGTVSKEEVQGLRDANGIEFSEAIANSGFQFKNENSERTDIKAFIELHVEQGGVLEIEKKSIGIVEHIVGQRRFTIEVFGQSNHAGTTPMKYRKDSLFAASCIITEIIHKAKEYGEPLVATVGSIEIEPNTANVVPGKAKFTLDIRHINHEVIVDFSNEVSNIIDNVSKEMNIETRIDMYMDCLPVAMDSDLVKMIKDVCEGKGLNYKLMHSGAGHDSQIFADVVPTALIFVPSHKGISHSPEEFTDSNDLAEGVRALIETLYLLAYQ